MSLLDVFRSPPTEIPAAPAPGELAISATGVTVKLGGKAVLRDVDLPVKAGEVLALVGPNGAGKSTLLAALAGDLDLDGGEIILGGEPLNQWKAEELALRRAVLLQQVQLSFPFTVLDVVQMGRAPWSNTAASAFDDERVSAAMLATDVTAFSARKFSFLSGGEKARVALSRVLAQDTNILMLDEPTAALDLRHQELVLQVARARAEAGRAVVVVLHDLNLAAGYADKVAVLEQGRLAALGTPNEVLTEGLLSRVYQYKIDVMAHPMSGRTVVLPRR
ncbi:iron complex transport system ATP-binding protein [Arthrobacter stackebrandtii]|uniref:Iron complex transport system ATP-binding protein n=1 Tax=Arthrobacter stackebrandtii TaxID=272161 RepID=A0ABS4YX71_9MICC|nr:iron complex transport system ATP-binding protein [Arthrobacter stackebrandtii]